MHRRSFLSLLGTSAAVSAWPVTVGAQQPRKVWRVGFLAGGVRPIQFGSSVYVGFLRGMRELGYVEGRDFVMEWRFAEARPELYFDLARELVQADVNVIVLGTGGALPAVQQASTTIPIVIGSTTDPVGNGYITSLARPGGNVTGLASSQEASTPKQLQLLTMIAPSVPRIGYAVAANHDPTAVAKLKAAQGAAEQAGRELLPVDIGNAEDIAGAFATLANGRAGALIVSGGPLFFSFRQRIAEMALRNRLPSMFPQSDYVEVGGLMSYGESLADFYRRAAFYVDKIFKGAKPADLPVQQPTRFFLTINRSTAEALRLSIPLELLVLADEIIE